MRIGVNIYILLNLLLISKVSFAKKQPIKFESDTIVQYATVTFQVAYPQDDSTRYELNSDVGTIKEWMGEYYFTTSHLGHCKIYLKDRKKNKIIYSTTLTSIKLPQLVSSVGVLQSGKVSLAELKMMHRIQIAFKPSRIVHLCEHELMLHVKSYTMYCLRKDTFYKLNIKSNMIQTTPDGFKKEDVLIFDNIKIQPNRFDTLIEAPPVILEITPEQIFDSTAYLYNQSEKPDFDSAYFASNFCLLKKKFDSGYILQLCIKDNLSQIIFEDLFINGVSKYRFCKSK